MKNKQSLKEINSKTKLLLINQNLLKNQICDELRMHSTSKISALSFKSSAERYRISLLRTLEQERATNISDFFTEYQKIVSHPKIPLLNIELAMLVYKSWKNSPQFINNFICLVQKMSYTLDSLDFWRLLLLSCNKSRINNPLNYQLLSVVISKVEWNEKSIPFIRDLVSTVFKIQSFNQKDSMGVISEKKAKQTFKQILIWIDCIFNQCLDLNNEERIFALIRIMESITKSPDALNFSKTKKTFLPFFNMLKSKFSAKIIFDASATAIDLVYFYYCQNPMLFINQEFFIKEYSDVENCLKKDILIISLFRKLHFPTILIEKHQTLTLYEKNWLVHVLKGNNLRTYSDLPFKLTKKGSHIFNQFKNDFLDQNRFYRTETIMSSPTVALIYSQLRANNLPQILIMEVLRKDIYSQIDNIEFWISTITLLYNKGLTFENHVSALIDFIDFKILQQKEDLDLKRISLSNLLGHVNSWHYRIGIYKKNPKKYNRLKFKTESIKGFKFQTIEKKYIIKQISSSTELFKEGKLLHHCVFSYLNKCHVNDCAIFSLRIINEQREERRLLTIEVRQNTIYQIKGLYNRSYNENEYKIIKLWAAAENLKIAV